MDIYERLTSGLDHDERIIYPEMYEKSPELYSSIEVIVLVQQVSDPKKEISWITERGYLKRKDELIFLKRLFIARAVTVTHLNGPNGFFLSAEDYNRNRSRYIVVDVYAQYIERGVPGKIQVMPMELFKMLDELDNLAPEFGPDLKLMGPVFLVRLAPKDMGET